MKYYLLKSQLTGEPLEILGFPEGTDMGHIQQAVTVLSGIYWDSINYGGHAFGMMECEYIASELVEGYGATLIPWSNTDILYF